MSRFRKIVNIALSEEILKSSPDTLREWMRSLSPGRVVVLDDLNRLAEDCRMPVDEVVEAVFSLVEANGWTVTPGARAWRINL